MLCDKETLTGPFKCNFGGATARVGELLLHSNVSGPGIIIMIHESGLQYDRSRRVVVVEKKWPDTVHKCIACSS
jgi:hypothetical protein